MKIAVIGAHGVGKTTFCAQFFAYVIRRGYNARLIHEVVRDCPFPINEKNSVESCTWITTTQIAAELDAEAKKVDLIICDRSAIDPLMYLYARDGVADNELIQNLSDLAHSWLHSYDTLVYVIPGEKEIVPDGIRMTDKAFQSAVDAEFKISIQEYNQINRRLDMYTIESAQIFETDLTEFFSDIVENSIKKNFRNI